MPECVGPMDPPFWTLFRHEEIFSIVLLCVHLNLKTLNMRTSYMGMLRLFGASQRFKLGPMIDNVDLSKPVGIDIIFDQRCFLVSLICQGSFIIY